MEKTLVILKPDCIQRQLAGRIISRFEDKGLKIAAMKMLQMDRDQACQLYSIHEGKDFYGPLVEFIQSGPVVAMVLAGPQAISVVRQMMGSTNCLEAQAGTIRGDFGFSTRLNLVHGSDSVESYQREMPIFFSADDILDPSRE